MQAPRGAQLTGTNRPRAWLHTYTCRSASRSLCGSRAAAGSLLGPHSSIEFPAAIAKGKHPVPFRTRKLSSSAPMVLRGRPRGRAGHRRNTIQRGLTQIRVSPLFFCAPLLVREIAACIACLPGTRSGRPSFCLACLFSGWRDRGRTVRPRTVVAHRPGPERPRSDRRRPRSLRRQAGPRSSPSARLLQPRRVMIMKGLWCPHPHTKKSSRHHNPTIMGRSGCEGSHIRHLVPHHRHLLPSLRVEVQPEPPRTSWLCGRRRRQPTGRCGGLTQFAFGAGVFSCDHWLE